MYVADERFTKNIDKYGEGLAQFMSDAMNIYCDNNGIINNGKTSVNEFIEVFIIIEICKIMI